MPASTASNHAVCPITSRRNEVGYDDASIRFIVVSVASTDVVHAMREGERACESRRRAEPDDELEVAVTHHQPPNLSGRGVSGNDKQASAVLRGGGVVYTSDVEGLGRLQGHFPTVVVRGV